MEACPRCYTSSLKNHWKQEPVFHKHSPQRANLHRSRSGLVGDAFYECQSIGDCCGGSRRICFDELTVAYMSVPSAGD
ncbi:hypothetical protein PVAP13_6NG203100 [Panicum virgatum]|uniref:Uncharacterized protein n=1 Tax=Panicum virgatum TaxID=38727 RepID=A0A8T0R1A1_PANVG|nr:hypothetical protein PVAP13_6NG203100 [Panicum virgatum]